MTPKIVQLVVVFITVLYLNPSHSSTSETDSLSEIIESGGMIVKFNPPLQAFRRIFSGIKLEKSYVQEYPSQDKMIQQKFYVGSLSETGEWRRSGLNIYSGSVISDAVGSWSLGQDGSINLKLQVDREIGLNVQITPDGRVVDIKNGTSEEIGSFEASGVRLQIDPDLKPGSIRNVKGSPFILFKNRLEIGNEILTGIRILQPGFIFDLNGTSRAEGGNIVDGKWVPLKSNRIFEVSTYTGGMTIDTIEGDRKAFVGFINTETQKFVFPPGFPKSIVSNIRPGEIEFREIDVRPIGEIQSWVPTQIKLKKQEHPSESIGKDCRHFYR